MEVARQVLLALTTTQGTRATLSVAQITQQVPSSLARDIITALKGARLLMHEQDGVTIAHEALLTHWRRLQWWVADARLARETADDLERDANRWADDPKGTPLLPRRRARLVDQMRRAGEIAPSERALAYLAASRRAAKTARVLAGVAVGVVVAIVALVMTKDARELAAKQKELDALGARVAELENAVGAKTAAPVAATGPSPAASAPASARPSAEAALGEGTVFPHKGAIANKCLAKLWEKTQHAVTVSVRVTVTPAGEAKSVVPVGELPSAETECVAKEIKHLEFSATPFGFAFTTSIEYTDTR
jgi:hypothetical protein